MITFITYDSGHTVTATIYNSGGFVLVAGTLVFETFDQARDAEGLYDFDTDDNGINQYIFEFPTIAEDVFSIEWYNELDNLVSTSTHANTAVEVPSAITMPYYGTIDGGDEYFGNILDCDGWLEAAIMRKGKALVMSTQIIDRFNYAGSKYVPSQEKAFPRSVATIPDNIIYACYEISNALLEGKDPAIEAESLNLINSGYANVRSTYDAQISPEHIVAGVPSIKAWQMLRPYLRDTRAIDISRVS